MTEQQRRGLFSKMTGKTATINETEYFAFCQGLLAAAPQPAQSSEAKDAARLDFLDGNLRMSMGWRIGKAPAGNLSVSSVIFPLGGATSIRDAIDQAMEGGA